MSSSLPPAFDKDPICSYLLPDSFAKPVLLLQAVRYFDCKYWLVPLVGREHWSLLIIAHPDKMFGSGCRYLHIDSIKGHHDAKELVSPLLAWAKLRYAIEVKL